jgi:hypothetical protein
MSDAGIEPVTSALWGCGIAINMKAQYGIVSRSRVGRWKWQRAEQLFDLPDVVR